MAVAENLISNRVREKTVKAYRCKLITVGKWVKQHNGEVGDDGLPTLPLDPVLTISFFGELARPRLEAHPIFGKPRKKLVQNSGFLSTSTAGGYKSAIVWLYTENKQTMDPGLNKEMNKLISGYKKSVGDKKQEGVISCFEGKRPLAFEGYKLLCTMFATLGPQPSSSGNHRGDGSTFPMGIFAWCFLTLQWNLIARYAKSVDLSINTYMYCIFSSDHVEAQCQIRISRQHYALPSFLE